MKKLLLIALLIVGCDLLKEENSVYICGLCNSSNECFCYTDVPDGNCSTYAAETDSFIIHSMLHGNHLTCEAFCKDKISCSIIE